MRMLTAVCDTYQRAVLKRKLPDVKEDDVHAVRSLYALRKRLMHVRIDACTDSFMFVVRDIIKEPEIVQDIALLIWDKDPSVRYGAVKVLTAGLDRVTRLELETIGVGLGHVDFPIAIPALRRLLAELDSGLHKLYDRLLEESIKQREGKTGEITDEIESINRLRRLVHRCLDSN